MRPAHPGSFLLLKSMRVSPAEDLTEGALSAQIDAVWAKLNEYDVNQKLRSACLPPAVIKYGDMVGA